METERVMDIELFLEGQAKWEKDSPYHLAMMYEMFRHAANEGQKEAEHVQSTEAAGKDLPKLDPEADLSAIQLVGPKTTTGRNPLPLPRSLHTAEVARISTWGT